MSYRIVQKSVKMCQLQVTSCLSPPVEVIFSKKLFQETFLYTHESVKNWFSFLQLCREATIKKQSQRMTKVCVK